MEANQLKRVAIIITNRSSYSKYKSLLRALSTYRDIEIHLILGASLNIYRFGYATDYIKEDWQDKCIIHPISLAIEGEKPVKMPKTVGLGAIEISTLFDTIKPHMVVTMADRFETLATAISASYMNIPLLHIQGGEITGSIDNKVRNAVTQLADIHCVSNYTAGGKVSDMLSGAEKWNDSVIVTGCPSMDLIADNISHWDNHYWDEYGGVGDSIDFKQPHIIIMFHSDTTQWEESYKQMNTVLQAIKFLDIQKVFFWPNIDAGSDGISKALREFKETNAHQCHFYRNVPPEDFLKMLYFAKCIVGNSSAGIRESSYMGTPSVDIGTRQMKRECADNVIRVRFDIDEIKNAIESQIKYGNYGCSQLYGDGKAGEKIAKIINNELTN